MYQRPQLVAVHNRYWALIRRELALLGIEAPAVLTQDAVESELWVAEDLVLSQTCGMPYRNSLHGRVSLVGTPDFGVEDCPPGYYRSAIVVHRDDPRTQLVDFADALFIYNGPQSQSGFAAAYHHFARLGFWFERSTQSGQHVRSAQSVAAGRADIAAIDAVTWRLLVEHDTTAEWLRVLDWTDPTPGLPYITADRERATDIASAVRKAIDKLGPADRRSLGIRGLVEIASSSYLAVPNPPEPTTPSSP